MDPWDVSQIKSLTSPNPSQLEDLKTKLSDQNKELIQQKSIIQELNKQNKDIKETKDLIIGKLTDEKYELEKEIDKFDSINKQMGAENFK